MPRNSKKRPTRAPSHSHARAVIPDGDEGKNLEQEERQEKIATMLRDFDLEVNNRVKEMKKDITIYLNKLQVLYSLEVLQLPKHVRDTRISDFLAGGGKIDELVADEVEDELRDIVLDARIDKCAARSPRKNKKAHQQGEQENQATAKSRKPPTGGGRTMRKTRQALMETPANQLTASKMWGVTPLVTPKFDPRLPITPAIGRTARPGEVAMSMKGSPIHRMEQPENPEFIVPLGRDKTMLITADTALEDLEVPDMSANTLARIKAIQTKLSRLIQVHDPTATK